MPSIATAASQRQRASWAWIAGPSIEGSDGRERPAHRLWRHSEKTHVKCGATHLRCAASILIAVTTGHFTQEDPIGLAGGMNLYRFAGGDPVNFSDPFD